MALPMCAQTKKMTFACKEDKGKSLHKHWSGGKGLVYCIAEAHIELDAFRFGVFFYLPSGRHRVKKFASLIYLPTSSCSPTRATLDMDMEGNDIQEFRTL